MPGLKALWGAAALALALGAAVPASAQPARTDEGLAQHQRTRIVIHPRSLQPGARTEFDLVPQMQVTLAQRQHVRANFGVRIPVNNFNDRPVELGFYLLWDWFDGGFRDGWRGLPK